MIFLCHYHDSTLLSTKNEFENTFNMFSDMYEEVDHNVGKKAAHSGISSVMSLVTGSNGVITDFEMFTVLE